MELKIIDEQLVRKQVTKEYTLSIDKDIELSIVKNWYVEYDNQYEVTWDFLDDKDKDTYASLTQEQQDTIDNFLSIT